METKALSGHYENSGIQTHSVGEHYPYNVVITDVDGRSHCQLWNYVTGWKSKLFPYFANDPDSYRLAYRDALATKSVEQKQAHKVRYLASQAYRELRRSGGFSINAVGIVPHAGYAVSFGDTEKRLPITEVDEKVIASYFRSHPLNSGEFWGGWNSTGETYLDLSFVTPSRTTALYLAKDNRQKAIYDVSGRQDIDVNKQLVDVAYAPVKPEERDYHLALEVWKHHCDVDGVATQCVIRHPGIHGRFNSPSLPAVLRDTLDLTRPVSIRGYLERNKELFRANVWIVSLIAVLSIAATDREAILVAA